MSQVPTSTTPTPARRGTFSRRMDNWWHSHPKVAVAFITAFLALSVWAAISVWKIGIAVVFLAVAGGIMSLRPK